MTVWDKDALSAPHSEREMGQIEDHCGCGDGACTACFPSPYTQLLKDTLRMAKMDEESGLDQRMGPDGFVTIRDSWPTPDEADAPVSAVPAEGVDPVALTFRQKLEALSLRFYQGMAWAPKAGDYYTTSRADLELYQVVAIEGGKVKTRYCSGSTVISEWPEDEFTTGGFGPKRVYVPDFVLSSAALRAQQPTGASLQKARTTPPSGLGHCANCGADLSVIRMAACCDDPMPNQIYADPLSSSPTPAEGEPTDAQVIDACTWYHNGFGLAERDVCESLKLRAREWLQAWQKALPAAAPAEGEAKPVAWTGGGSLMALADGREGFIFPHSADAHPIPLYDRFVENRPSEDETVSPWREILRLRAGLWSIAHAAEIETKTDLMRAASDLLPTQFGNRPLYAHPPAPQPVAVEPGMVKVGHVVQICEDAARERRKLAAEGGDEDQKRRWIAGAIQAEILSEKIRSLPTTPLYPTTPAAQVAGGVEVKPLVWMALSAKYDGGKEHFGTGIFGHWYGVKREKNGTWRVAHHIGSQPVEVGCFPTLDAAKAAAQADYEARIRAALTGGAA